MLQLNRQWGSPARIRPTRPPLHQRRRWGDANDISIDPHRLSLDHLITIFPTRHDQSKSESDLSIRNWVLNAQEGVERPPTPSPICSPFDTSCSTPYSPPRHFCTRPLPSQYSDQLARSRSAVHEKSVLQQNPEGFYRRKGYDMTARSSSPSSSRSCNYNAFFDLKETKPTPPRTEAGMDFHHSNLHSHHGFSVRRANLPRKSSSEYSLPSTVQLIPSETETSSVTISQEGAQSDQEIRLNSIIDANASGSCYKKSVTQPKTSLQGFEPSTLMQNINLPAIKEEDGHSKSKETLESSGSGSTGSKWDECRSNGEAGSKNMVTVGMGEREFRSSSMRRYLHNSRKLMAMGNRSKRDEIEARTIAWQEARTAKILNRLKREESLIGAWESEQRAKAEIHMTKVERKLEEKRTKELERTQNKIAQAHKKAEQRKAAEKKKISAETARMTAVVDKIQSTGKLPWKFMFF